MAEQQYARPAAQTERQKEFHFLRKILIKMRDSVRDPVVQTENHGDRSAADAGSNRSDSDQEAGHQGFQQFPHPSFRPSGFHRPAAGRRATVVHRNLSPLF